MDEENDPLHINLSLEKDQKHEFIMSTEKDLRGVEDKDENENVAKEQEKSEHNISTEETAKNQEPSEQYTIITEDIAKVQSEQNEIITEDTARVQSKQNTIIAEDTAKVQSEQNTIITEDTAKAQSEQNTITTKDISKHQLQSDQNATLTEDTAKYQGKSEQNSIITEDISQNLEQPEENKITENTNNADDKPADEEQAITRSEVDNDKEIFEKEPIGPDESINLKVVKQEETDNIDSYGSRTFEENEEIEDEVVKQKENIIAEEPKPEEIEHESSEEEVDPAAPYNLRHSVEDLRRPYKLPPDVEEEVQRLWETFQNYTPSYSHIDGYITLKELPYMLKSILLMPHTPEQLMELVDFICDAVEDVKKGIRITYEQFLAIVKMRHRVFDVEEELRAALDVFDPKKTGQIEGVKLKEILGTQGHKMPSKMIHKFLKEVDLTGDGLIGIEDVVAICGIELPPRETSADFYNVKSMEAAVEGVEDNPTERESMNTASTTVTNVTRSSVAVTDETTSDISEE